MLNVNLIKTPAKFIYLQEITSTMEIAADYAKNKTPHLTTIFAESQTNGRGRRGKIWQDFTGCNISITIILREVDGAQLSLVVSIALQKALSEFTPTKIKWPNDILLNEKKLAGILIEKCGDCYLLGIGINVKTPKQEILDTLENDFQGIWLEETFAKKISRESVINTVFKYLQSTLKIYENVGWQGLEAEYKENCITLNKDVTWVNNGIEISGIATALTKSGALKLKGENGKVHTIHTGDVLAQGKKH